MITPLIKPAKIAALFLLLGFTLPAQTALDKYIEMGIKNNLVLQQKNLSLEKALFGLKEANRLFYPSVSLLGDYLSGDGGRSIDIPVGDLMNPVYATLNQLTSSQNFPQIENSSTNFFPENYYDLRIRASMPILNSDLIHNKKIRNEQVQLQEWEVDAYRKELTASIRVAYYRYLTAIKAIEIYESAVKLANEGKRINESLLANGKSLRAYVIRSESELQTLEAKRSEAMLMTDNARMYFNFLINAEPLQPIDTNYTEDPDLLQIENFMGRSADISKREELKMLQSSAIIQYHLLNKEKSYWHPRLSGFFDVGSQDSHFNFDDQSRYYLVGVQLNIPLFAAGKNHFRVKQTEMDYKSRLVENTNQKRQLQLSADMARNDLSTSYGNYKAALKQLESANAYYRLIERGYREGINSFIETIDARNQVTNSSLQVIINRYDLFSKLATYKREISL